MSRTIDTSDRFDDAYSVKPPDGFDATKLRGKTAVITGGGSGIGEASLRAFVKAGAFVAFSDLSKERGESLEVEFSGSAIFVEGDVTKWTDQLRLFKTAIERSPSKTVDVVFANAGIAHPDGIMDDSTEENGDPREPDTLMTKVNLIAVMYTAKLAHHYWKLQPDQEGRDRSLIMTASIAGYWDHPSATQYAATKWAVRGMMRALRQMFSEEDMRVNLIAPWYIRTSIAPGTFWDSLQNNLKVEFAEVEDAARAVTHLAADASINGRTLAIVPRSYVHEGYIDLRRDNFDVEHLTRPWHSISK